MKKTYSTRVIKPDHVDDKDLDWRPVPRSEYAERYEVYQYGELRNRKLGRIIGGTLIKNHIIYTMYASGRGHWRIGAAPLVAQTFGLKPTADSFCVRHRNEVLHDCHVDNLYWATGRQASDSRKVSKRYKPGSPGGLSDLTDDDVLAIRASKRPHLDLAKEYKVSDATIAHIRQRKTWQHIPHQPEAPITPEERAEILRAVDFENLANRSVSMGADGSIILKGRYVILMDRYGPLRSRLKVHGFAGLQISKSLFGAREIISVVIDYAIPLADESRFFALLAKQPANSKWATL